MDPSRSPEAIERACVALDAAMSEEDLSDWDMQVRRFVTAVISGLDDWR
jgi:hypothetical protein